MNSKENIANSVFSTYKHAEEVYITTDGIPFLEEKKATGHQTSTNRLGGKEKLTKYKRESSNKNTEKNVEDLKNMDEKNVLDLLNKLKQKELHVLCHELNIEKKNGQSNSQVVKYILDKLFKNK